MTLSKKPSTHSPTDNSAKLRPNDLALKKRTTFPTAAPKKLAYKINIDAYKIDARVATNAYKCTSLITKRQVILPGDQIIKLRNLSEEEVVALVKRMEELAEKERITRSSSPRTLRSGRQINANFVVQKDEIEPKMPNLRRFMISAEK